MPESWESPRAYQERMKRERRLAFRVLMEMVDAGELEQEEAFAELRAFDPETGLIDYRAVRRELDG